MTPPPSESDAMPVALLFPAFTPRPRRWSRCLSRLRASCCSRRCSAASARASTSSLACRSHTVSEALGSGASASTSRLRSASQRPLSVVEDSWSPPAWLFRLPAPKPPNPEERSIGPSSFSPASDARNLLTARFLHAPRPFSSADWGSSVFRCNSTTLLSSCAIATFSASTWRSSHPRTGCTSETGVGTGLGGRTASTAALAALRSSASDAAVETYPKLP
mmetsp:Transcript_31521/g.82370  ORF Transcript_31521/g.82370 Transcript_31521/m.82370 type:complete len:220 (-) Transcript_31521:306-965(-)